MKKIIFTVSVILLGSTAMAQGPYVSFNVGYGLATPSEVLGIESEPARQSNIYGTLGGGLNLGLTPGYMFSEHFGVELGLNYFMGSEVEVAKSTNSAGKVYSRKASSNQFRVLPSLVVSTGGEKMSLYAKAGLVVPVAGSTITKVDDSGVTAPVAITREVKIKGQYTVGFSGAIGGTYNLSDKLSLFAELTGVNLRIKAKSSEVTKATNAGQDVLGVMTTSQKQTEFEDELNTGVTPDPNSPSKALASKNNFGAVSINIGIKYNF